MVSPGQGWRVLRRIDHAPAVPWSNGGGTTRELVGYDESAALGPDGCARWRLSIALLERPGGFSPLPGVDRTFLLVGGDAVLSVDGERHRLQHGDAVSFGGEQAVVLESLGGTRHAVNLMVERATGASAPRLRTGLEPSARFVVAIGPAAGVARFDLLERSADDVVQVGLPDEVASLTLGDGRGR